MRGSLPNPSISGIKAVHHDQVRFLRDGSLNAIPAVLSSDRSETHPLQQKPEAMP
jgi:hypothetical protein